MAATRGVDVGVMVGEMNEGFVREYGRGWYFCEVVKEGMKVYEYEKGLMDEKVMMGDGEVGCVGRGNVDMRRFELNFEVN
ncbi:phospholipase D-like domain-containing protein, partial [Bacillus sp. WP8]|uniref:phospholipase D-like domain-containing protein n=1 Tax=Bacillus sp. WP8 TaxID=756828 RepID=UPI0021B523B5